MVNMVSSSASVNLQKKKRISMTVGSKRVRTKFSKAFSNLVSFLGFPPPLHNYSLPINQNELICFILTLLQLPSSIGPIK